jgi:hypothetical protein
MEVLANSALVSYLLGFGMPGAAIIIWWLMDRSYTRTMERYREDTARMYQAGRDSLDAVKRMYENNVILVQNYEKMAEGLQSMIVLNTQTITRLCDRIDCRVEPGVRR